MKWWQANMEWEARRKWWKWEPYSPRKWWNAVWVMTFPFIYLLINTCSIYLLISREEKCESLTLMSYENEDGILYTYTSTHQCFTQICIKDVECLALSVQIINYISISISNGLAANLFCFAYLSISNLRLLYCVCIPPHFLFSSFWQDNILISIPFIHASNTSNTTRFNCFQAPAQWRMTSIRFLIWFYTVLSMDNDQSKEKSI